MFDRQELDETTLRRVYGCFPSGVVAVCARTDEGLVGMTLSTFIPVSLDPPLVAISVRRASATWPILATAPALGLSALAAGHEGVARQLSSSGADRFAGVRTENGSDGAAWLVDAPVVMTCVVECEVTAGDHLLVVLSVQGIVRYQDNDPLVFHASHIRALGQPSGAVDLARNAS